MNNYYILIYLKEVLKENIIGGKFQFAISPHKDVLECYIEMKTGTHRLITSANPAETAIFLDDYRPPKKRNVLEFFNSLQGQRIVEVFLAEFDRLLNIKFENEYILLFKLYGNDVNVLLTKDGIVQDAFKHPENSKGEDQPKPHAPKFAGTVSSNAKPKNQLTKLNPLLPRNLLPALVRQHQVSKMESEQVKRFTDRITEALGNDPHPRVLKNGKLCLWSEQILNLPTEKEFETVNKAVRYAYRNAVHLRRLSNKKEHIEKLLKRSLRKIIAQQEQLQNADKSLQRADKYEKYGHLLMAHAHEAISDGRQKLEVTDFYEENKSIVIRLKSDLTIPENAEYYYEKAKAARTSYQKAKQRIPKVAKEKKLIETLNEELTDIDRLPVLNKWIKKRKESLQKLGYGVDDQKQATSPYRKFKVGKYEVWIGKNAKSNDQLTSLAHKEDIWLHARGVAGSHTVIRMGNQKEYPPQEVILRAASYAAHYSKAKGAKTAPVIYTKRKYIYKPKGAAPGAVAVDQEQVVMVPPMKPNS